MKDLLVDVLHAVLSHCDHATLATLRCVSRDLRKYASHEALWQGGFDAARMRKVLLQELEGLAAEEQDYEAMLRSSSLEHQWWARTVPPDSAARHKHPVQPRSWTDQPAGCKECGEGGSTTCGVCHLCNDCAGQFDTRRCHDCGCGVCVHCRREKQVDHLLKCTSCSAWTCDECCDKYFEELKERDDLLTHRERRALDESPRSSAKCGECARASLSASSTPLRADVQGRDYRHGFGPRSRTGTGLTRISGSAAAGHMHVGRSLNFE